jgi:membrane-associated phospholipid phosphatase
MFFYEETEAAANNKMLLTQDKHNSSRRGVLAALMFVVGLVVVVTIYMNTLNNTGLALLDEPVREWLVAHRTSLVTLIMLTITNLVDPIILLTVAGSALWAWRKKEYWYPSLIVCTLGGAYVLSSIIKDIIKRDRPPVFDMVLPVETGFSFPSRHTFGMAIIALIIGYVLYSRKVSAKTMYIWAAATIVSVALIAISRIYLGYHWLTDVTASIGLAFLVLAVVIAIDCTQKAWWSKRTKSTVDL